MSALASLGGTAFAPQPSCLNRSTAPFDRQPLACQVASERRGLAGPQWSEIVDIPLLGL
jgi:hypothetical protein